tara:strand:+ start:227 stop:922 length:696 start_codon:yes stop_codon:yes gene_type:complete
MPLIYAHPYDMEATGFQFKNLKDYKKKYAKNKNAFGEKVEEYEFEILEADEAEDALWNAMGGNGGFVDLKKYFNLLESGEVEDTFDVIKLQYLMEYEGMDVNKALRKMDDLSVIEGDLEDWAYDAIESMGAPRGNDYYFDYDKFGRDLRIEDDYYRDTYTSDEKAGLAYFDAMGEPDEVLSDKEYLDYFDFEAYGRDAEMNRQITEVKYGGDTYVVDHSFLSNPRKRRNRR